MTGRRAVLTNSEPLPGTGGADPFRELFEACKTGDLVRVKQIVTPQTVNARDTAGRKSTPLHFAAGEQNFLFIYILSLLYYRNKFPPEHILFYLKYYYQDKINTDLLFHKRNSNIFRLRLTLAVLSFFLFLFFSLFFFISSLLD